MPILRTEGRIRPSNSDTSSCRGSADFLKAGQLHVAQLPIFEAFAVQGADLDFIQTARRVLQDVDRVSLLHRPRVDHRRDLMVLPQFLHQCSRVWGFVLAGRLHYKHQRQFVLEVSFQMQRESKRHFWACLCTGMAILFPTRTKGQGKPSLLVFLAS